MQPLAKLTVLFAIAGSAGVLGLVACGGGGGSAVAPPPGPSPSASGCVPGLSAAQNPLSVFEAGQFGGAPLVGRPMSRGGDGTIPGRINVRLASPNLNPQLSDALWKMGAKPVGVLNKNNAISYELPRSLDANRAALALRALPGVVAAGPAVARYPLITPNDPRFTSTQQWDMYVMDMPDAWSITQGSPLVRVAVIDTGADLTHPELQGKIDATAVFDQGTGMMRTGATVQDCDGHGTNVSGIAAADTNNLLEVASTGWNVHLLEARVFPYPSPSASPMADTRDIAAAIDWAVANGAKVINLSIGSSTPDNVYEEPAVSRAINAGVVVVGASGNDGTATIDYPAADPGVISVGASAITDTAPNVTAGATERVASYSNYGSGLDVVAPGGDPSSSQLSCGSVSNPCDFLQWILNLYSSTAPMGKPAALALFAGTSQATPHVSAIAALMLSKNGALSPAQVRSIIDAAVDDIGGGVKQGHGRVNACKALVNTPPATSGVTCSSSI